MTHEITPADAGCWLDGHFGWHNTYRVIDLAVEYGFALVAEDRAIVDRFREGNSREHEYDIVHELADEATEHLQGLAPEGYYFEWDMGELCLVRDEED